MINICRIEKMGKEEDVAHLGVLFWPSPGGSEEHNEESQPGYR
jgi:hypothetical protein